MYLQESVCPKPHHLYHYHTLPKPFIHSVCELLIYLILSLKQSQCAIIISILGVTPSGQTGAPMHLLKYNTLKVVNVNCVSS